MAFEAHGNGSSHGVRGAGPYVLRTLFADVPLSEDGSRDDVKINCVEYLGAHISLSLGKMPRVPLSVRFG